MPKKESKPGGLQKFTLTLLKKPLSFCRARLVDLGCIMEEHMYEGTSGFVMSCGLSTLSSVHVSYYALATKVCNP